MADEPDLREGANDEGQPGWVTRLQGLLEAAGHSPGAIDGWFGPRTEAAARSFQEANDCTVDGWVGPQTWGAINALGLQPVSPPATGGGSGEVPEDVVALGFPASSSDWTAEQRESYDRGKPREGEEESGSAEDVELLAVQSDGGTDGEALA